MKNGMSLGLMIDVIDKLRAHINNIALHHTIFDLPFAFMAAFLAAGEIPDLRTLLWIALAMMGGRAAGLAIDNLADEKYDAQQVRMHERALVSGAITRKEAYASVLVYMVVCIRSVAQLHPICLKLLPFAVIPFIIYPFTKRFTCWCHLFLGFALSMAPAGGWVAVKASALPADAGLTSLPDIISLPMIMLCTASALWIGAFDAIYGAQDAKFDKEHGLHSMAAAFGANGTFLISGIFHIVCIILFAALGYVLKLSWPYYLGVCVAAVTLYYQHSIVKPNDFSKVTQWYFMRNGIVSVAFFFFTWFSL